MLLLSLLNLWDYSTRQMRLIALKYKWLNCYYLKVIKIKKSNWKDKQRLSFLTYVHSYYYITKVFVINYFPNQKFVFKLFPKQLCIHIEQLGEPRNTYHGKDVTLHTKKMKSLVGSSVKLKLLGLEIFRNNSKPACIQKSMCWLRVKIFFIGLKIERFSKSIKNRAVLNTTVP